MSLRGFDRRGCAAALHNASASGFTVSGCWSDLADFAVVVLFDADDQYGHLFTSRYLPDFDLTGILLDFDLAITGGMYPGSSKYQSVPWGQLSFITAAEVPGIAALNITSTTGLAAASITYTVSSSASPPAVSAYDRIELVYLGNVVFDFLADATDTPSTVVNRTTANTNGFVGLVKQINDAHSANPVAVPFTAVGSGSSFAITCTQPGTDGNTIQFQELHKTSTMALLPAGASKMTGGTDPTSMHVRIDFSALGIASLRQAWLTLAPPLPIDSGGVNPTLVAFAPMEFSYVVTNWAVTDPGGIRALKIAGAGSTTASSRTAPFWFTGSWVEQGGFFLDGFARVSGAAGDSVTLTYSCQYAHDLYLGTQVRADGGKLTSVVDGVAGNTVDTYANTGAPLAARRLVKSGVAAGTHQVVLTISSAKNAASSGWNCVLDFVQAVVRTDVVLPAQTYANVNVACDYDTGQTYQIAPARALWILDQLGFHGDIDFYAGVFFALKRMRVGGRFHFATVTLGGIFATGTGFGDGDAVFVTLGGTGFGAAVYPADTLTTLAQRLVDGINGLFVGVRAAPTGTAGQFTVTQLSPINGFTLGVSKSAGATGTIAMVGDIATGNEGVWGVDASQTSPLNRAFADYLADFAGIVHGKSQTMTVAFSQELLAPPDANTAGGAWTQRFADGSQVLTATAFGSWGAGVVEYVSTVAGFTRIQWTGHGQVTGNIAHLVGSGGGGVWRITVVDADHFDLTTQVSNTGAYAPVIGDTGFFELQTSQCCFNPATVTAYLIACYQQAAGILNAAGLTPWLQLGEVGWWFYSRLMSEAVGYASWTAPVSIGTPAAHGFDTGQNVIVAGIAGTTAANGTWPFVKTDATHGTLTGSNGNANYVAGTGTVSGGGMAYYDAYTAAEAVLGFSRPLASFWTQDDDPASHASDVALLVGLLYAHMHAIASAVKAAYPAAKFEWLLPMDVNAPAVFWTWAYPYPQGGRMNHVVNIPAPYMVPNGDIDRVKIEALSLGSGYYDLDRAKAVMTHASSNLSYALADTAYLVPCFTGGCAWGKHYRAAVNGGIPLLGLWAFDQWVSMGRRVPLPENDRGAQVF